MLALAGCGSGSKSEGQKLGSQSLLVNASALPAAVVTDQQLAHFQQDSAAHAYLTYWQSLQFQGWKSALAAFDPRYVRFIGPQLLMQAFQSLSAYWRATRPAIYSARPAGDGMTEIRLIGNSTAGQTLGPQSADLLQVGGQWRIEYDSILDQALLSSVEEATQEQIDPAAQLLSQRAIRAGLVAQRLQLAYLAALLRPSLPHSSNVPSTPRAH